MTIGIDHGDVWSHYCTLNEAGEVVDRGRFRTNPKGLKKWFTDLPPARVGAPEKPLSLSSFELIFGRRSVSGSPIGGITSDVEVIAIQQINEAYERLLKADVNFHDLRRTAVRNKRRAGVPQVIRMKISGHKTDSMERRYNLVDADDLSIAKEFMKRRMKAAQNVAEVSRSSDQPRYPGDTPSPIKSTTCGTAIAGDTLTSRLRC